MTWNPRYDEASQVSEEFQIALAAIGAKTIEDAIKLWQDVPPSRVEQASQQWLRMAIKLVMHRRSRSRALGRAYYRLVRALITGTTVKDPYKPEPRYITLDTLRDEFEELARSREVPQQSSQEEPESEEEPDSEVEVDTDEDSEDAEADRILVEELEAIEREQERIEQEAEREAQLTLEQLGPNGLKKRLEVIDTSEPADEVDEAREEAHRKSGARQAADASRLVKNGARSTIWSQIDRDKRALGYIRLSRTGTPCAWCAMLISRGPVYKSQKSAATSIYGDGDKYHDNCNCYAEPVWSLEQYNSSSRYELNRKYKQLWPQVTKGLTGKDALAAWRRFFREEQKAQVREAKAKQQNVQEA